MVVRRTPYARLRYPWTADVVSALDVQSMAQDIDQGLVDTAKMGADYSRMGSVVARRTTVQSIPKGVLTAISFNTTSLNNGSDSPLANGDWHSAANPTRLTAPVPCIVLVSAFGGMNLGSALGANGAVQVTIGLNGGATWYQGTKWGPLAATGGQQWASALGMYRLAQADYLELRMYWTGTPAGPFNTDTVIPPQLGLTMVALQSVP